MIEAWCICELVDGQPRPMIQHVQETKEQALRHRDAWLPEDLHRFYPIRRIDITVRECPWQAERKSQAA